jgi:hypothetical protein
MDNEFEPMHGDILNLGMHLNIILNDEHVPEVEGQIRTIKERTRSVHNTLHFKKMPT